MICHRVVHPILVAIRIIIETVREVVRQVCRTVTRVIRTVREVIERVCQWLPWPLNQLCNLVTRLVEVVERVTEWICEEVIERVIEFVQIVYEYVIYIVNWVCWAIDWIVFRWIAYALCRAGVRRAATITLCPVFITSSGTAALAAGDFNRLVAIANRILAGCNIQLVVGEIRFVEAPRLFTGIVCDFRGLFRRSFSRFSSMSGPGCVTVFIVQDIVAARGCSFPGSDWIVIDAAAAGCTIPHEIGHLSDLWGHSDDPNNLMAAPCGNNVTAHQCCMLRTSKYTV